MNVASLRVLVIGPLLTGLLVVIASPAARAQEPEDLAALNAQVKKLYAEGKYAEATDIAERSLAFAEKTRGPDNLDVAQSANNLALLYQYEGRYPEAEPLYRRSLAIREKSLPPDHPDVGKSLNNLAWLYQAEGRYVEAEPLYQRTVSILEKALGPDHPDVAQSLNNLASLYQSQGRYPEAEPLCKRSLAIREKALGPDNPDVGKSLISLAALYQLQARYPEAEPLYIRSLAIREKALGPDHPVVAQTLNDFAELYRVQGRYPEAGPLYRRSLSISEKMLGPDHPTVAQTLNNFALLYIAQGRYAEAEPLFKRSLSIREKALGAGHPDVGKSLNNLANMYQIQGRYPDAAPLYKRSLSIVEKALGPDHPNVAQLLSNLAELDRIQGRYPEAEPLYKRSLAIREKALGSDHPDVAQSLNNLANMYQMQGRYPEAEPLHKRSLAIREKALGNGHPDVAQSLNDLAELYRVQGRNSEAEPIYHRSLGIRERALGPDHPAVAQSLSNLALLHFVQSDWARAGDYLRRSTAVTVHRAQRGTATVGTPTGERNRESERLGYRFLALVKVAYRLSTKSGSPSGGLGNDMFETAQWAHSSEAAASLAQMAARAAGGQRQAGSGDLAGIVRERQDLLAEWQRRDSARTAAVSLPPDQRDRQAELANAAQLTAIDARIAAIDARLKVEFPDYAALASPEPLTVEQVQSDLRPGEALVLFLDTPEWKPTPEETFIWVVTKTDIRWVRSALGTPGLTREVAALRCGLDYAGSWRAKDSRCRELLETNYASADHRDGAPLPFDAARAYDLYKALFGEVEELIQDKHLLIVPSGPLTQLPFHVLVTSPPTSTDYGSAAWLARSNAITVLPAVSSLKSLRQNAKASAAKEPFIGFGNPVLAGNPRCGTITIPEKCPDEEMQTAAAVAPQLTRSLAVDDAVPSFYRNGLADVTAVRALCPLPDTAHELTCVARSLGAPASSIILGRDMTETALKKAPLNRFRVIHFATHGLLAVETSKLSAAHAEPALVMSPPEVPTEEDDGLLTASEIAALRLDADWVVMSACNTAGGGEQGAEALSGLARAFFYAGARALLVSHWPVSSYAATMLTSRTFAEMREDASIGRSEAFRRAMLALMSDSARPWASHPSVWAPFVVVGEGAAGK